MKNRFFAISAVALGVTTVASADFTGWSAEVFEVGGYYVMNVYATSNSGGDEVLNVHGLNVQTNGFGGFHQAAANPFWQPGAEQNQADGLDSWLTLGTHNDGTAHDGTVADANMQNFNDAGGANDFSQVMATGDGAGWGVGNPNTNVNVTKTIGDGTRQGAEGAFGVLVAHFVVGGADLGGEISFVGQAIVNGLSVNDSQTFSFIIPGPGALALLGLAGVTGNRRRR